MKEKLLSLFTKGTRMRITMVVFLMISGMVTVLAGNFNNFVIFGNSLSDAGNLPNKEVLNYGGRWSNGIVWNEYLAPLLNLPIPIKSFAYEAGETIESGKNNFAVAGALTHNNAMALSIDTQINSEEVNRNLSFARYGANFGNKDLVALFGGANDYNFLLSEAEKKGDKEKTEQIAVAAANAMLSNIETLLNLNARAIIVLNLPDLSKTIRFNTSDFRETAALFTRTFNDIYWDGVDDLIANSGNVVFYKIDIEDLFNRVIADPQHYGFEYTDKSLVVAYKEDVNVNPDKFVFYDEIHPTTAMHKLVGDYIYSVMAIRTKVLDCTSFNQDEESVVEKWSWNNATRTLTLSGVNIVTAGFSNGDFNHGVVLPDGATLILTEGTVNNITNDPDGKSTLKESYASAILGQGELIISGKGAMNAKGEGVSDYVAGIAAYGNLTINDGVIAATGGDRATLWSVGITTEGERDVDIVNLTINGGIIDAIGGSLEGEGVYSDGIFAVTNLIVNGGTITATAGDVKEDSFGMEAWGSVVINGGSGTASTISVGTPAQAFSQMPTLGNGVEIEVGSWDGVSCTWRTTNAVAEVTLDGVSVYGRQGQIVIENKGDKDLRAIEMVDVTGRIIQMSSAISSTMTINTRNGIYVVRLETQDGKEYYFKVLVY